MPEDPIEAARADGRTTLTEAESKALLADAGVAVPAGRVVEGTAAAREAAAEIGYPVALKVSAPSVVHKSEWADGAGAALGLESADAVEAAARRILDAADAAGLEAAVLVEEYIDPDAGTEIIVGGLRDPSFGPVVLAGLGGVLAEAVGDTSHRLAPIDRAEAREAIGELEASALLDRRPAADRDALAAVLCAVGDLVVERPAFAEIDVNPVLALPDGAVALDAAVVLREGADG